MIKRSHFRTLAAEKCASMLYVTCEHDVAVKRVERLPVMIVNRLSTTALVLVRRLVTAMLMTVITQL